MNEKARKSLGEYKCAQEQQLRLPLANRWK
jgi:hypothetical protein